MDGDSADVSTSGLDFAGVKTRAQRQSDLL
jgi:hypothetical protein